MIKSVQQSGFHLLNFQGCYIGKLLAAMVIYAIQQKATGINFILNFYCQSPNLKYISDIPI